MKKINLRKSKRLVATMLALMTVAMTFLLASCESAEEAAEKEAIKEFGFKVYTLDENNSSKQTVVDQSESRLISIYSTSKKNEFLAFLTNLEPKYKIIDVSTAIDSYQSEDSYMVSYIPYLDENEYDTNKYKYYIFTTEEELEYRDFYGTFNFDKYEILDITCREEMNNREPYYIITFREIMQGEDAAENPNEEKSNDEESAELAPLATIVTTTTTTEEISTSTSTSTSTTSTSKPAEELEYDISAASDTSSESETE